MSGLRWLEIKEVWSRRDTSVGKMAGTGGHLGRELNWLFAQVIEDLKTLQRGKLELV